MDGQSGPSTSRLVVDHHMHCSQVDNVEFGVFVCPEDMFACIGLLLNCSDVFLLCHGFYAFMQEKDKRRL